MKTLYSQNFTLKDIFTNEKLKGKIPLIRQERDDKGRFKRYEWAEAPTSLVKAIATQSARPFYKDMTVTGGDTIVISGTMSGDLTACQNAVYSAILAYKPILSTSANCMDIIKDAFDLESKQKKRVGFATKLYLRANSMLEIENMSASQMQAFMNNVLENIFFGDVFFDVQKKWGLENRFYGKGNYERARQLWRTRVGL